MRALKALASARLGWVFGIGSSDGPQAKTSFGLLKASPANVAFRSRGHPAQGSEFCLSFSVQVPGAMGLVGTQYRE